MNGEEIFRQIEAEKVTAEKYLLSGPVDRSAFSQAVAIVEERLTEGEKYLLDSRRRIEQDRRYKSRRHWVIKTQFVYNQLTESGGYSCTWISESKIKREWRGMVSLVAEVAARISMSKKKKQQSTK